MQFLKEFFGESPLEWIGVMATLLGIYLTVQGKLICWLVNILASLIYFYVFFRSRLYADASLQWVFIILSVWGWKNWNKDKNQKVLPTKKINKRELIFGVFMASFSGFLLGYFLRYYTNDSSPYLDGLCFSLSVWATYLTAKYILENWLVWILTDLIYVMIYIQKRLYPTAFLYLLLCFLAILGYKNWKKSL